MANVVIQGYGANERIVTGGYGAAAASSQAVGNAANPSGAIGTGSYGSGARGNG